MLVADKWQETVAKHGNLIKYDLGFVKDVEANLIADTQVQPQFYCPRPVPYALKEKVGEEPDRLQ